jgi:uncharacterized NAD(P)/FAD-binding protein YdhS
MIDKNNTVGGRRLDIAIIGMGAAGISVLREWVRQVERKEKHSLTIYSDERLFGTGLPYQKDDESLLLNQYAETMSLLPEDELHFVKWVEEKYKVGNSEKEFLPRAWYGEYLKEVLSDLLKEVKVTIIKQSVLSLRVTEEKQYLVSTEKETKYYDMVHLTTGHLAYQDFYDLNGTTGYIHLPYPVVDNLSSIKEEDHVGILGTGLTAVDLLLYLKKNYPSIQVSFFSPDGKFGSVRGEEEFLNLTYFTKKRIEEAKKEYDGLIPLEIVIEWFLKECSNQGLDAKMFWENYGLGTVESMKFDLEHLEEIGAFQSVIHSMTEVYADIWNALSTNDRRRFMEQYAERFTRFRSPLPQKTSNKIVEFVENGSVSIYKGISSVEKKHELFHVTIEDDETITVDCLLNGTGQLKSLTEEIEKQQPLIKQLVNERILAPYTYGGVQVVYPSMSALSTRYGQLDTLKLYGQLVSGIDYMNNTVELISRSAIEGVKDSLRFLEK